MLDLWELNVSKVYRHGFTIEGREGAPSQSSSMPSTNGAHSAAIVHSGSDDTQASGREQVALPDRRCTPRLAGLIT